MILIDFESNVAVKIVEWMVNAERKKTQGSDFVLQLMNAREGQSASRISILIFNTVNVRRVTLGIDVRCYWWYQDCGFKNFNPGNLRTAYETLIIMNLLRPTDTPVRHSEKYRVMEERNRIQRKPILCHHDHYCAISRHYYALFYFLA